MNIGEVIRTLRKEQGMKQCELAKKTELSVNAICQIEKGKFFPKKSTIKKISEILGIPATYILLFSLEENDFPKNKRLLYRYLLVPLKAGLRECENNGTETISEQ